MDKDNKLSRSSSYLSKKEITFLTQREPTLGKKAAEDGRKRSTVLPPLEREPTFQRKPKHFNPYETSLEESADSHWKRKYDKVISIEVDNKIKSHLKKQLNRRLEKKYQLMVDEQSEDSFNRHGNDYQPWEGKQDKQRKLSGDLFKQYTDLGEKSKGHGERKHSSAKKEGPLPDITPRKPDPQPSQDPDTKADVNAPLPDIKDSHEMTNGVSKETVDAKRSRVSLSDETEIINGHERSEEEQVFELTRLQTKYSEAIENFRNLDVSPIQTPIVLRPLTREQTRLSFDDRMSKILQGQVHHSCPPSSKTVRLYVSSGFADSEPERTMIMERVLPEMRTLCALHGRELQMYDLHWGLRNAVSDDHSTADVCLSTLELCCRDQLQSVNLLVFLTEKYGNYILPSRIPADEFEAIRDTASAYRTSNLEKIHRKLEELGVARDTLKPAGQETESRSATDVTSQTDGTTVRSESTVSSQVDQQSEGDSDRVSQATTVYRKDADVKRELQLIKSLREKEDALPDVELLEEWYRLDENVVPPVYSLQKISAGVRDYGRGDAAHRDSALHQWREIEAKLLSLLQQHSKEAITDPFVLKKYFRSLLELELEHGVLETDAVSEQTVVVQRTINDLSANLDDDDVGNFVDLLPGKPRRIDRAVAERMESMTKKQIPHKVSDTYILPFEVSWGTAGIRLAGDRAHQMYLDRMCKLVAEALRRKLLDSFREEDNLRDENSVLFEEISQHVKQCQERSKHFQGRKDTLQVMKSYIRSPCSTLLAVYGPAGSGKTSLLAKAAKETHKWMRGTDVSVLVRVVGASKESTNIRSLLHSLSMQLCVIFGNDTSDVPTDFIGLMNDFEHRLHQATEKKQLVIFIDSLDRLSDEHSGRKLSWLPKTLPPNVHLIVSTLPDEKFECMSSLKTILADKQHANLEIPELPQHDAIAILEHWYNVSNRTVTPEQYDVILSAFEKCPSPLYLRQAFSQSLSWTSYMPISQARLSDTVKKLAGLKFGQMETKHGEALTRRAIGYLAASRSGLTDFEMIDLLSLDDAVMPEFMVHNRPLRRRVPNIAWIRLKLDLYEYLVECNADDVRTSQFAHSHFLEAAQERYLNQRDKAPSYHKAMAEYFLGMWSEKPKPYPGNDKGALRYVAAQPLYLTPKDAVKGKTERVYNLRKINELPHHLLYSQQSQQYKSETMCNFEWVLAKLCGTSLRALVEEYHIGLEVEPSDLDLKILSDTLQLSGTALLRDPRQLAGQVVGRIQGIVNRDVPSTPGDPPKYPYLHTFLNQAKVTSISTLVPSIGCLTEPGGILFDLLLGHSKAITAVTLTSDAQWAVTASQDDTLKVWDLKFGKVIKTIEEFGTNVSKLRTAYNNHYVISVEENVLKIWSMGTGELLFVVDQYPDPPVISLAAEGKLLVALFDGANVMRTWDLGNKFNFVCEAKLDEKTIFKDNSAIVAPNSYGEYVLHAQRGTSVATIQHARNGKVVHVLKCNDSSSAIVALAITRDYMVVACRQHYMKLHEIHQLELFDAKKGKYLRSVRGCTQDIITELHINQVGSHAIAVCASDTSNSSNIMIWNLETEDHKHLARHSGVSTMSACADFRYCLTARKGDNTLKIWNISKNVNQPMPKFKKSLGVAEIHPMIDNPRYAIARQVNHGPISIWNVAKAKCLASAVRIERGLSDTSDVVLIHNIHVIILTEKGLKDSRPVYKTILRYDLQQKRYVKKVHGCAIVPSPVHEYTLLDADSLLGPADTRNHFIIWNLETGKEMFRIRPRFKELETRISVKDSDLEHSLHVRASTAKMTPWDRRTESKSARKQRRDREKDEERKALEEIQKEKQNGIEQYIISGDLNTIVASFFAHHLCVFDVATKLHTQTLENEHSMLFLHVAALSHDGRSLVHANYDENVKTSYVTLWDTTTGEVKKRLENEMDVLAIAITEDASRVVFGKSNKELRIWDTNKSGPTAMKSVKGYDSLEFGVNSQIFTLNKGRRAVVFAGDISLWDLEKAILLAVFTPDTRIECLNVVMNGQLITFGVHDFAELVVLKIMGSDVKPLVDTEGADLFGESTGDTSDEDEDEDDM